MPDDAGGKNIVLCLDGTSNQYGQRNSNVVRLYECLDLGDPSRQVGYYDPGVGTFSAHPVLGAPARAVMRALGMAFGLGLTVNVKEAYRYLMEAYVPGDRIYVFGFSRGAYTARVLAGWINMCGLLRRGNGNLVDYAFRLYRQADFDTAYGDDAIGLTGFKDTFAYRGCRVHMLGLWDTVATVGWIYNPKRFPYTRKAYSVRHVRHALALDERRAFFQNDPFDPAEVARRAPERAHAGGTIEEVWFAGVHSDVGGGYPYGENHLARIPLAWMLDEARALGLALDPERVAAATGTARPYAPPAYAVHASLWGPWHLAEVVPKKVWDDDAEGDRLRVNLWRRRVVPEGARVHASVYAKMEDDAEYRPGNVPPRRQALGA